MDKVVQVVNIALKITGFTLVLAYILMRYQLENQCIQSAYNSIERNMKYIESLRD